MRVTRRRGWLVALILVLLAGLPAGAQPPLSAREVSLTPEERAWLDRNPDKLVWYHDVSLPPIEFLDESGALSGIGPDLMARVEQLLGVTFVRRPVEDWNEVPEGLKSGACALSASLVKTPEREAFTFFTNPYVTLPVVILVRRDEAGGHTLDDLRGRRVGVVSGYASEKFLRDKATLSGFDVVPLPGIPEGLRELSLGKVDAFVDNLASLSYYIGATGSGNLKVSGTTDYAFPLSIGVSRRYPLLFSALQKALAALPGAELEGIRKRWVPLAVEPGLDRETLWLLRLGGLFAILLAGSLGILTVLLKRRLAQKVEALRESENRYRRLAENSPAVVCQFRLSPEGEPSFPFLSEACLAVTGVSAREGMEDPSRILRNIHPQDAPEYHARVRESAASLKPSHQLLRYLKDGGYVWIETHSTPERLPDGSTLWDGFFLDVTERKRAEEDRQRLQEQLNQSRKMESVGRLAGGVAHDFNNMLGVILGRADLALAQTEPHTPLAEDLREIRQAAERSADLTRQLLAFARKQTVVPRVVDLNAAVEGMLKMLRRIIGEGVELDWRPGADLGLLRMDPSQIDQILANLCVNARDATEGSGRVGIRTEAVTLAPGSPVLQEGGEPGDYVVLSVSDDGCGMTPEALSRLFEPYYTTKEAGRGTGLGLATIYGIVRQNGGQIQVQSEPQVGTTFRVYLPRYRSAPEVPREPEAPSPVGGGETVLLVEDEPSILRMTELMLRRLGYRVRTAGTPEEARELADRWGGEIRLLLTDVVMPGQNGRDLALELQVRLPHLRVLFMSGYTSDVIAPHGVLDPGVPFIQKPFSLQDLGEAIRTALDRKGSTEEDLPLDIFQEGGHNPSQHLPPEGRSAR